MAIRDGMQNLVDRVRALTGAGTAEYTVGSSTYWVDTDIQDILDSNSRFVVDVPLIWIPQSIGGGTVTYTIAQAPYRDFEELASGTARWVVRDGPGNVIGTAGYTVDYRQGQLAFTSDQGGSAYYLTAYTYDVYASAADLWMERIARFALWYDFRADNQSFSRNQAWDHAIAAEKLMRGKAGANVVGAASGDLRVGQFVRTDLNMWSAIDD